MTEDPPTPDQLRSIFEYLAGSGGKIGELVKGATDQSDALKKLGESGENFMRPVVSLGYLPTLRDWNAELSPTAGG